MNKFWSEKINYFNQIILFDSAANLNSKLEKLQDYFSL